jgi:PAS domain S-box-containing protein
MTPPTSERTRGEAVLERRLAAQPGAAGQARRALDELERYLDPESLDDARLLTSELVTNAVRHGPTTDHGEVALRVYVRPDAVRVEVVDVGLGFVPPAPAPSEEIGGWGLVLVDRVAARWGVNEGPPTTVWFELARPDENGASSGAPTPEMSDHERLVDVALTGAQMGTWDWDMRTGAVHWSESLERIHGLRPGTFGGRFEDFQADVHPEDRSRVLAMIEAALHEGREYALDYRIVRPASGETRWLAVRGSVIRDDQGHPAGMTGVCLDVTERKETDRRLHVQYAVARVLADSSTLEEAAPELVRAVAESLGWELGALWRRDDVHAVMRFVGGWCSSREGQRFLERSRGFAFERGLGVPGRIWASGRPVWVPDTTRDDNFPRAPLALEAGLHAAFGFPITLGPEVLGVVEFHSRRIREPDEGQLAMMEAVGAQIGQFLERTAAEADLVASEARKSAVLESALEAIVTMGIDGRIIELNQAAAEMFGRAREDAMGSDLADVMIPERLRERHREALQRFRRTGRGRILGRRLELVAVHADGSEFPVEVTITRVELPDPEEMLFTGYIRDITPRRRAEELQAKLFESERAAREELERANARTAFLANASVVLGASLDHRRTLAKIARLIVPRLADWCTVDLLEGDGSIQSVAAAHADSAKTPLVREYRRRFPVTAATEGGVAQVIASGQPMLYPEVSPELLESRMQEPERRALLAELGLRSVMVVPLVARDNAIGSITFASASPERTFDPSDLDLAQELARRAALALDNARLYEERSHIARTLQRSLLPRRLPEIPGIEVAAFYQASGISQTEVGGDFYDVFEADESWCVVVGDVCGKGIDAAALTGMARHTLRATVLRDPSPSAALRALNDVMLREDGERFCTVALGRLDPAGDGVRLRLACGGHPSPLIVRVDGEVEAPGAPGSLLGVFEEVVLQERSVGLDAGDLAVFYTDGLIDARHPSRLDERALRALAGTLRGLPAQDAVDRMGEAIADPGGEAPDDVCVVVLRIAR